MVGKLDTTVPLTYAQKTPDILLHENDKALKEQTDAFEAVFLKQMLDITMSGNDSLFPKSPGSDIYKSMYTDILSKGLSGNFGYSEMLFKYLKENK